MLRGISIRNFRLVERLDIEFFEGLNVLTGETGAGKTVLLDSLDFALGRGRAADVLGNNGEVAEVSVEFELEQEHPANETLRKNGLSSDGELLVRRVAFTTGRTTAFANDRRCTRVILESLRNDLINLHGQHDDKAFLGVANHRRLLDRYGDHGPALRQVQSAWQQLASARKAKAKAVERQESAAGEVDFLRKALKDLETLDPQPNEASDLDERRRFIRVAENNRKRVGNALQSIGMSGAIGQCGEAIRQLERIGSDRVQLIEEALNSLERASVELDESMQALDKFLNMLEFDPFELENVEERLFTIRSLARKHRTLPDRLHEVVETVAKQLESLDACDEEIQRAEAERLRCLENYDKLADALTALRRASAARLDTEIADELAPLKLKHAKFRTDIQAASPGMHGKDRIRFLGSANPGQPLKPINRFASGGELARFMLAFKACLTTSNAFPSMVFDEIDSGLGGATAAAVGFRLRALACKTQVVVVTHSPQVGAMGQHHCVVRKKTTAGAASIDISPLTEDQRVDEIARMLSGERISDEARQAARVLLSSSSTP